MSDCEAQSMATKQQRVSTNSSDSSVADKKKRWQVSVATFKQWQTEYETEYQSLSWLCYMTDKHDLSSVNTLTCAICTRFEANIRLGNARLTSILVYHFSCMYCQHYNCNAIHKNTMSDRI